MKLRRQLLPLLVLQTDLQGAHLPGKPFDIVAQQLLDEQLVLRGARNPRRVFGRGSALRLRLKVPAQRLEQFPPA